jgi:hypothetical protein
MSRYIRNKPKRPSSPDFLMPIVITALIVAVIGGYFVVEWIKKLSSATEITTETSVNPPTTTAAFPQEPRNDSRELQITPPKPGTASDSNGQLPDNQNGLPNLLDSDVLIRQELGKISPGLLPWLGADQLVRRYMIVVNDFAQGQRIASHMSFLRMEEPFLVEMNGNELFISAKSYHRYNNLVQAVQSINAAMAIKIYKQIRPLMLQVFAEFGYPKENGLETILKKAVAQILIVPVLEGPIELIRPSLFYKFADTKLESLNSVQKQILRMGPANTRIIQAKLREFLAALAKADIK